MPAPDPRDTMAPVTHEGPTSAEVELPSPSDPTIEEAPAVDTAEARPGDRGARRSTGTARRALTTVAILAAIVLAWAAGSALELWSETVLPPPDAVASALVATVQTSTFWDALRITLGEIAITFGAALVIGFLGGCLFWKVPYLGRVFEPFLVSFYAVPFIVFYPVMVVLVGLNSTPIILLATIMAVIPMILNSWIGLSSVRPVYWKLGASLECSRRQTMFRLAVPAAAPIILAGVRLAMIYSLIGTISMEFLLAPNGLGFQVRNQYEIFEQDMTMAYVLIIFALAGTLALVVAALENWILGRRRGA